MSYVTLILQGLASLLKWLALKEEVKLKMLVIDRKEKYENEAERIKGEIDDLRLAGRDDLADVLYQQLLRRTEFIGDLPDTLLVPPGGQADPDEEGDLHPPSG